MPKYPQHDIIRKLFSKGQPMSVGKGDVIIGNGNPASKAVYYIGSGYVKEYSIGSSGDEYLHLIYGSGEILPLVWSYLGIEPEGQFYEAIADTVLWRMSREWFTTFIKSDLGICYAMSLQLAQQYRVFVDRVDNLEYKKASERVVYRLLFLASRFGAQEGRCVVIDPPITHELFANSVNLARESVSREFEKLEHEGIVQRKGRQIVIQDVETLASMLSRPVNLGRWYL